MNDHLVDLGCTLDAEQMSAGKRLDPYLGKALGTPMRTLCVANQSVPVAGDKQNGHP